VQQITEPTAELSIEIDSSPEAIWAVVSDVTRVPSWSPACYRCEWIDEGRRFRGYNRLNGARWSRECVVTASEPGRVFAFSTLFKGEESTRWRYSVEPGREPGDKTTLREAYRVVMIPRWVRAARMLPGAKAKTERDIRWNIEHSLERIKQIVEASNETG